MRRLGFLLLLVTLLLAGTLGLIEVVRGQEPAPAGGSAVVESETLGESRREISAPAGATLPEQPAISFIDSPTASCYQPNPNRNECFVNWYYMSVSASPNYMIAMTATIQSQVVARYSGFFQTSMYVPYDMLDKGIQVPCGALGSGGNPQLGKAYSYTIRARDSSNLKSANYGTVYCPAYIP